MGVAQPTADASAGKPLAASVNAPAPAEPIAASPPKASQSLDSKPAPTISLPLGPTQIAPPTPAATNLGGGAQASEAPLPPVRPAQKAAIEAAGKAQRSQAPKAAIEAAVVTQRSTSKLDLPTKLSSKSAAHVVVTKAGATGLRVPVETPSEPLEHGASVSPEKGAKTLKVAQAPTEAQVAPTEQPVQPAPAHQQPNPNPVVHAFNNMVGALASLIPFAH
jgi:hypothetical protein